MQPSTGSVQHWSHVGWLSPSALTTAGNDCDTQLNENAHRRKCSSKTPVKTHREPQCTATDSQVRPALETGWSAAALSIENGGRGSSCGL